MARDRITQADLEEMALEINQITSSPTEPHTDKSGGCYHLDYAYGGVKLVQICRDGSSAIRCISSDGFDTKRKLYNFMQAYIAGMAVESE